MGSASRHRTKKPAPLPGWIWLATGLGIGLFVAFLVYLGQLPTNDVPPVAVAPAPAAKASAPAKKPAPESEPEPEPEALEEPEFSFYTELLTMEVEVPVEDPTAGLPPASKPVPRTTIDKPSSPHTKPEPVAPPTKSMGRNVYVLQLPSFKSYRAADSFKARLALLGVATTIQPVSVDNKEKWYRLRAGPYATSTEASATQSKLRRERVPSVLLKINE